MIVERKKNLRGEWLGLVLWDPPALHLRARDHLIAWSDEQRRTRPDLIAMPVFCGMARGQRDLAAFARTVSQGPLRALGSHTSRRAGRVRCLNETNLFRPLQSVDKKPLEQTLLGWKGQVLGPVSDTLIAGDGKALRHVRGGGLSDLFRASAGGGRRGQLASFTGTPGLGGA